MNKIIAITILFGTIISTVNASNYEGKISQISFGTGESPARVSIDVGTHGSECTGYGGVYYSYENADNGLGKIWTSAVLTAYAAEKTVLIAGTGTCDPYGIEKVLHINVK